MCKGTPVWPEAPSIIHNPVGEVVRNINVIMASLLKAIPKHYNSSAARDAVDCEVNVEPSAQCHAAQSLVLKKNTGRCFESGGQASGIRRRFRCAIAG